MLQTDIAYSEADFRVFQTFKGALNSGANCGESIPDFVQGAARL